MHDEWVSRVSKPAAGKMRNLNCSVWVSLEIKVCQLSFTNSSGWSAEQPQRPVSHSASSFFIIILFLSDSFPVPFGQARTPIVLSFMSKYNSTNVLVFIPWFTFETEDSLPLSVQSWREAHYAGSAASPKTSRPIVGAFKSSCFVMSSEQKGRKQRGWRLGWWMGVELVRLSCRGPELTSTDLQLTVTFLSIVTMIFPSL